MESWLSLRCAASPWPAFVSLSARLLLCSSPGWRPPGRPIALLSAPLNKTPLHTTDREDPRVALHSDLHWQRKRQPRTALSFFFDGVCACVIFFLRLSPPKNFDLLSTHKKIIIKTNSATNFCKKTKQNISFLSDKNSFRHRKCWLFVEWQFSRTKKRERTWFDSIKLSDNLLFVLLFCEWHQRATASISAVQLLVAAESSFIGQTLVLPLESIAVFESVLPRIFLFVSR